MKANTPFEILLHNSKAIKELQEKIAPLYKCVGDLGTQTISIAKELTNVSDEQTGFLIDTKGNVYKITANDGESLLLDYYTTIEGAKGEKGDKGDAGQNGTNGTNGLDGFSIHYANVDFNDVETSYLLSDISTNTPIKENDVVLFKNMWLVLVYSVNDTTITMANGTAIQLEVEGGSGIPTITIELSQMLTSNSCQLTQEQYEILQNNSFVNLEFSNNIIGITKIQANALPYLYFTSNVLIIDNNFYYLIEIDNNMVATIVPIEFIEPKQLYQHNIILYYNSTNKIFANISITNDSNLTFNAYTLKDYLINNNIVDLPSYQNGGFVANGWVKATYNKSIINIYASTDYPNYLYFGCIRQDNGTLSNEGVVLNDSNLSITDTIIPL